MSDPRGDSQVEVEIAHEALLQRWPRLRGWLALHDESPRYGALLKQFRRDPARSNDRPLTRRIRRLVAAPAPHPAVDGVDHPPLLQDRVQVEVAHEALIRHWPKLRAWLDEDRADLLLRESVRGAAQEWDGHGRDESYLAHGRRLDQAEELRQHPRLRLSPLEEAYLLASLALREREEQEQNAQRQRELAAERERAELAEAAQREAELRVGEQVAAARQLRRRFLVAAALGALAVLAAGYAFVNFREAEKQRTEAIAQRKLAEDEAHIGRALALVAAVPLQLDRGENELAALLARQAHLFSQKGGVSRLSQVDEALRATLNVPHFGRVLASRGQAVFSVAFSPDGELLATGGADGAIRLWTPDQPAASPTIVAGHVGWVTALAFDPDGKTLAVGGSGGAVLLSPTHPETPPVVLPGVAGAISSVTFSAGGEKLAAAGSDGTVRLWDPAHLVAPTVLALPGETVSSVAFSPNRQTLAAGSSDGRVRLWDLTEPNAAPTLLAGATDWVSSVAFSKNGQTLVIGGADGAVRLADVTRPGAAPIVLPGAAGWVFSVALSQDGRTLAAGGSDGAVRLWDPEHPAAAPRILPGQGETVSSVAFSPTRSALAAGTEDGTVRLWDLGQPAAQPADFSSQLGPVSSVAFSPDGLTLASGSEDGTIQIWPLGPGEWPTLGPASGPVSSVAFSPDGRTLAAGSSGGVQLWNPADYSAAPTVISVQGEAVSSVAFSQDGRRLAAGGADGTVRLWDTTRFDSAPESLDTAEGAVTALAFSPVADTLAAGSEDGAVRLWNLAASTPPVHLTGAPESVSSVAYSPNGMMLAAGGTDGAVRLWDLEQPDAAPARTAGDGGPVLSVAFSPDGGTLAAGSADGAVRMWDPAQTAAAPAVLAVSDLAVSSVAFNPITGKLATGDFEATVHLWIAHPDTLAGLVCEAAGRNLSLSEWSRFVGPGTPYEPTCNLPAAGSGPVATPPSRAPAPEASPIVPGDTLSTEPLSVDRVPAASLATGRLAYSALVSGQSDLFVYDFATQSSTQLTSDPAFQRAPAWSNAGDRLAFISPASDGTTQVWVMDASGSHRRQVTHFADPGGGTIHYVEWAASDLSLIVTVAGGGQAWLMSVPAYGGDMTPFVEAPASHPAVADTGQMVIVSVGGPNLDMVLTDPAGNKIAVIANTDQWEDFPSLSPDGQHVVYQIGPAGSRRIATSSIRGEARYLLPQLGSDNSHPVWAPGGSAIALVVREEEGDSVWIARRDGREVAKLDLGAPEAIGLLSWAA